MLKGLIMKRLATAFAIATMFVFAAQVASAQTLKAVKDRGQLVCGANGTLAGFGMPDAQGNWTGFDVDFCRAIAAAIFNDPTKVKFVPLTAANRITSLQSGDIDVLSRNTTWTMSRDTTLGIDFAAIHYYDGQGFMVHKALKVSSALELNDASVLYGERVLLSNPNDNIILPEIISKEPLSPAVRQGDDAWEDLVRWVHYGMVDAEELGVSKATLDDQMKSANPEIRRLLGVEGQFGESLGLTNDWAVRIIKSVGNYGESFEATVGQGSPLKIARGLNALWTKGGLQYGIPVR